LKNETNPFKIVDMRRVITLSRMLLILIPFLFTSCGPTVKLTSWKNPQENARIGNVVVWGMFERLEYQKPFEQYSTAWLNKKGFKAMESLKFIAPGSKHDINELEKKFDSLGVDGILVVTYKGTDKTENYVPQTTSVYPDYYYNYYNYYNWGYPRYGYGANVVTTGGYWTTSSTLNLHANLYSNTNNGLLWSAEISLVDPEYIDQASTQVISQIYNDLVKNGLINGK
jgi:hypothetical protein